MLQSLNKWGKNYLLGNNREGLAVRYCKWPPMSVFIHISCEVMPYFSDVWAVFYTGGWIWWQSEQPGIKKDASSLDTWYSDTFIFNPHDKANFTALLLKVYKLPHQLHDSFFFWSFPKESSVNNSHMASEPEGLPGLEVLTFHWFVLPVVSVQSGL